MIRWIKRLIKKIRHGYTDKDLWCLFYAVSVFMIPRLKEFQLVKCGYPADYTPEQWDDKISKMIIAFELIERDEALCVFSDEEERQVEEGLDIFREDFFNLWD